MKIDEIIKKVKTGYRLYSKKGRNLGTYPSRSGAEKRERQVQYFKHMSENNQQTQLPVDVNRINKIILQLETSRYFTSEQADSMRRALSDIASGRQISNTRQILELLTVVSMV